MTKTKFKNSQIYFIISLLSLLFLFYFFYFPFFLSRAKLEDLIALLVGAKEFILGKNIYQRHLENYLIIYRVPKDFVYLPLLAIVCIPLLKLDFYLIAFLWVVSQHLFLIASIYICLKLFYKKITLLLFLFVFTLTIFSYPVLMSFTLGQTTPLLLFLITLSLYFFINKKDLPALIFLSLATYLKIFPIGLLIIFLNERKKNIFYFIIIFLILIMATYIFMPKELHTFIFAIFPLMSKGGNASPANQSITSFLMRLLIPNSFTFAIIQNKTLFMFLNYFMAIVILTFVIKTVIFNDDLVKKFFVVLTSLLILAPHNSMHWYSLLLPSFIYIFSPASNVNKKITKLNILALFLIFFPIPYFVFTKNGLFILLLSFPLYGLLIHWISLIKISSIKN